MDRTTIDDFVRTVGAFAKFDHDVLKRLSELLVPQFVKGGDTAVVAGDPPDGLYLVVRGRLAVLDDKGERIAVLSAGDLFGETAALGSLDRTHTVAAIRDSELLKLEQSDIDLIFSDQSDIARALTSHAIARLVKSDGEIQQRTPATVAVIGIGAETTTDSVVASLGRVVERSTVLRSQDVDGLDETSRRERFESIERQSDLTIFDVGPASPSDEDSRATRWADQSIRQADSVVIVAPAQVTEKHRGDARWIRARLASQHCITELIVEHPAATVTPRAPTSLAEIAKPHRAHNVRSGDEVTTDRAARLITGRGRGLVFSGGAAKGLAHIGAWRAICELGIPIDAVAGVSFGALLGAGVALEYSPERMERLARERLIGQRKLYDFTLPTVALFKGAGASRELTDLGEGRSFDQVWRSFCCCACDLNSGDLITLSDGPLWRGVRASLSIPGLFPPLREGERILVDGAVRDNVPVAPLRQFHPTPLEVIAVDVGKQGGVRPGALPKDGEVSGWRQAASRLNPRSPNSEVPSVAKLMMRVLELSGQDSAADADLIIRPDLTGLSVANFRHIEAFEKVGYDATIAALS